MYFLPAYRLPTSNQGQAFSAHAPTHLWSNRCLKQAQDKPELILNCLNYKQIPLTRKVYSFCSGLLLTCKVPCLCACVVNILRLIYNLGPWHLLLMRHCHLPPFGFGRMVSLVHCCCRWSPSLISRHSPKLPILMVCMQGWLRVETAETHIFTACGVWTVMEGQRFPTPTYCWKRASGSRTRLGAGGLEWGPGAGNTSQHGAGRQ